MGSESAGVYFSGGSGRCTNRSAGGARTPPAVASCAMNTMVCWTIVLMSSCEFTLIPGLRRLRNTRRVDEGSLEWRALRRQ